jgi:8-oxo-dGTP pyrophosphatase MutT (NUDIX family)
LEERSAGGVLLRPRGSGYDVCLILVRSPRGRLRWQLPKGHIEAAEASQEAARREVSEETGCRGRVLADLGPCEYFYARRDLDGTPRRVHKRVDFFLLAYESGSVSDHDAEVEEARFIPLPEAERLLAFESEKETVRRARELLCNVQWPVASGQ